MRLAVSDRHPRVCTRAALAVAALVAVSAAASAQTTVTLNVPQAQVVYATLRGGAYADTNFPDVLETRSGAGSTYERRAMLKFDTQNTIPVGSEVSSAVLTLTLKGADAGQTRHVAAYQVTQSWTETETTWKLRRTGQPWATTGGTLGTKLATALVTDQVGSKVSFDVTALVQAAVAGQLGSSRYTRVMLIDLDGATKLSWRAYYPPDEANVANRPTLVVSYGGTATVTSTPPPAPSGSTLKVLEYNVHHNGVGTDGVYDPNRVATWIAKMNPDIVSLVEIESRDGYYSGDGPTLYKTLLEQKTGKTWYAWDIQSYGDWTGSGIRNAILSTYPIISSYRHALSVGVGKTIGGVTIAVNGRNVNFMSTHIDPYTQANRITECQEIVAYAGGFAEDRIVLGDFNALPGTTEINEMTAAYHDAWTDAVALGTQQSAPDNPNGYTRNRRIDYVFYSKGEQHLTLKSAEVVDTRDASGVMPSDHRPLVATFTVK
jgi:endonuclease/exonuclease/phosphatase family metal-dependent hydrolase